MSQMSDGRMILTVDRIEEGIAVCLRDDGTVTDVILDDSLPFKVSEGDRICVTDIDGALRVTELLPVDEEEYLKELNIRRENSKAKEVNDNVVLDNSMSYGIVKSKE